MIDPRSVCLYIPNGLKKFKLTLFERIGREIEQAGGTLVRGDPAALAALPAMITPVVGCSPELRQLILDWRRDSRPWIYWDRGYVRRVFATWLPRGENGGYYRWHLNNFQMQRISNVPADRWDALRITVTPWRKNLNGHVVVALPTKTYSEVHGLQGWTENVLRRLARLTQRQIVTRDKESKRPLQADLEGAYCLVAHGSMAAVESVVCGCPVIVHPDSAASLVGATDLDLIEQGIKYPDRQPWLRSLAYCQFNETELVDGTLWRLMT